MSKAIRTYSDLIKLPTFEERYRYLRLNGQCYKETFGSERYLNQSFYRSKEWKQIRDYIIVRDNGCDLGIADRPIDRRIIVHHMNPISLDDIYHSNDILLDPEYMITTTLLTHNAIHYGDESLLITAPVERKPGDTCLWR